MKKFSSKIYLFAFSLLFFIFANLSYAQNVDVSTKFPYKINFTAAEIKFLNSLDETTLLKLIAVAQNLLTKNSITASTSLTVSPTNPSTSSGQANWQPTQTSNSPTSQTPYYNPQTGQYQNTPAANNSQSTNPMGNLLGGSQSSNPYLGNNNTTNQYTPSANLPPLDQNFKIPENILPECRQNSGMILDGGGCSSLQGLNQRVQLAAMQACTVIKKPITISSAYRSPACNSGVGGAGESSHMSGLALDIKQRVLTSSEKQAVFLVFRQNGFNNVGCYKGGPLANVHLDLRSGGPRRWGSSYHSDTWNPANCPAELIQVFGS